MAEPSEYTPSMHHFRRTYANRYASEADVIAAEAKFDRALAAHDAEVRARAFAEAAGVARNYDTGYDTTAATIAEALTDAAAARGVVAEEPEWEYGVRGTGDTEPFTDHYDSLDAMSEEFDGRVVWNADEEIVRRRKAGPWVPVKQEGGRT